jgi:hypothetical protein
VTPTEPTSTEPTSFTSPLYAYRLTLPAGWTVTAATVRWDGVSAPGHEEPVVDRFEPPGSSAAFWAFAGPVSMDLDAFVKDRIAANLRDHGDHCPPDAEVTEPITIAGQPGEFIAWNCGILINQAVTVHGGLGFTLLGRDRGVHAATDPADRATLDQLLESVTLPG